jgi:hypothetical protein
MSNRNHMNVLTTLSIRHEVWEAATQNTPGTIRSPHSGNWAANPRMPQNQVQQSPNLCEKLRAQSLLLHLIPGHDRPQFLLSRWINTEAFHFESNSFSMR